MALRVFAAPMSAGQINIISCLLLSAFVERKRAVKYLFFATDNYGQKMDGVFISADDLSPDILHALRAK